LTDAARSFAAVDLGAESGRVIVGRLTANGLALSEANRFANTPVALPDGLHWNPLALFEQMRAGLAKSVADGPLSGIGIDAWGVDYGLLDRGHRLLGIPFHYRDPRTEGMIELAGRRVPAAELYARTGIQTMPINTVFQLLAEAGSPALEAAQHIALMPDLLGLWLTGSFANEMTIASTTGLLDARSGAWAWDLAEALGLPTAALRSDLREPGNLLGRVRAPIEELAGLPVWSVASHDTASAFVAAPVNGAGSAILSSGTWSLLGVELDAPILDRQAAAFNLTNERGIDGSVRLLRNVMGLWLLQECRRHWQREGISLDYPELERLASGAGHDDVLFDPDHPELLRHGDMASRIAGLCRRTGQRAPHAPGEFVRAILLSLACKYNLVLERLRIVTRRQIDTIHLIGGGVRNRSLCQLTADMTGLPVLAGPAEATALGNILVQVRAAGEVGSLHEMRELVAATSAIERFEPADDGRGTATYERFLAVTGLTASLPEPTHA
jgi:rhamnulokinase